MVTRTPTQVASHAQKFFLRQNSTNKDRKRSSIHDINTYGDFCFSDLHNNINDVQDQQNHTPVPDTPDDNFSVSGGGGGSPGNFWDHEQVEGTKTTTLNNNNFFPNHPTNFLDDQQTQDIKIPMDNFPNYPNNPPDQQLAGGIGYHPTINYQDQQAQGGAILWYPTNPHEHVQKVQGGGIWYSTDYQDHQQAHLDHQEGEIGFPNNYLHQEVPISQGGVIGYPNTYLDQKVQLGQGGGGEIGYPKNYFHQVQLPQGGGIGYPINYPDEQVQLAQGGGFGYPTDYPDFQTEWQVYAQQGGVGGGFQDFGDFGSMDLNLES